MSGGQGMKKYTLANEKSTNGLFQIIANRDFGSIKKGTIGGFIASEKNLSQGGNAWVYGNAQVSGDAQVSGNAWVYGDAQVYGDARVYGDAWAKIPIYIQGSKF